MTLTVLKNYIDSSGVSTVSDEQSLADGQTVVIFDLPSIASAGFYICGDSADNGRLCDEDYTVDNEAQITLAQSYPAGTIVQALLNEPVGSDITDDQVVFDNVALMKLAGLGIGQLAETKGYYTEGDGGQASYLIEAFATTPDGFGDHLLTNGNVALLQMNSVANVKQFGAKGDDSSNDQPAIQAATNRIISLGGGDVLFDGHVFRMNGAASVDQFLNCILVPFQGVFSSAVPKFRFIGVGGATLQAMTDDTIILRASTPGLEVEELNFKGLTASTNVIAIGAIPEDYNQIITKVSQSYQKVTRCTFRSLTQGYWLEGGPTIAGGQSGSFYPNITNCDFNLTKRGIYFNEPASDPTNRVTRANIAFCRFERGNTGIDLAHASETTIIGCYAQFMDREGPNPTDEASFLRIGVSTRYTWLYGGTGEANTYDIYNLGDQDNSLMVHGFPLTSINFGIGTIPVLGPTLLRLTDRTGDTETLRVTARDSNFAALTFDWDANGTKDANIESSMIRRMSWLNGVTTHYGSVGNVTINSGGNRIEADGSSFTFACTGGFGRLTGAGTVALNNGAGDVCQATAVSFASSTNGALSLGDGSRRWSEVYAQNGTINTSDEREKTSLVDIEEIEKVVAIEIKSALRKFKFKTAVALKGDGARIHFGVGAQTVKAIFESHGLDPHSYSMFCYDEWGAELGTEEDNKDKVLLEAGNCFGIRYEQLLCFIIAAM